MKTEKETPAGEYTGAFSLSLDGQKYDVPVTVTVWDFTVPDEVHARNSFYLFQDELSNGQWDNTKESYQKYVDYFLDYSQHDGDRFPRLQHRGLGGTGQKIRRRPARDVLQRTRRRPLRA